jgi:hypothetical protein
MCLGVAMRLMLLLLVLLVLPLAAQAGVPPMRGQGSLLGMFAVPPPPPVVPRVAAPAPVPGTGWPGMLCRSAISAAERAHGIPPGLLLSIGLVESGRTDPATGQRHPWPWAVNAEGRGALLETREAALAFVREEQARGVRSIDVGCMQVNRVHHPNAFASLEQGFEPMANADYAARFLKELKEGPAGGDWMIAAGFYHSRTPERADGYRSKVKAALAGLPPSARVAGPAPVPGGGGGHRLSNGAGEVSVLAAPPGLAGRGLAAYRANPVPLAFVRGIRAKADLKGGRPSP